MLGAGIYPITLAEMEVYAVEADATFKSDEHERLKEFLALHPECGDVVPDTGGIRLLRWPVKNRRGVPRVRVFYFFRDLNMPLYLLALYRAGEKVDMGTEWKREMSKCIDTLIAEHSKGWARIIRQELGG